MGQADVMVNGVRLGTIDSEKISLRASVELERTQQIAGMVDWLVKYAAGDEETILTVFEDLKFNEQHEVIRAINAALRGSAQVPKVILIPSSKPSSQATKTPRGRRGQQS